MTRASDVRAAVATYYGQGAVLVDEVGDSVGFRSSPRRMDMLALGCWPSRGLFVHSIEVKVSKGDLARELREPKKAEAIARYCDQMWIAAPKGVADPDALPLNWGLYEVSASGTRVAKQATGLEPLPLDRGFLMAVIRACMKRNSEESEIQDRINGAVGKALEEMRQFNDEKNARDREALETARRDLYELRSALSTRGRTATPQNVSQAIAVIDSLTGNYGALNSLRVSAKKVLDEADAIERLARVLLASDPETATPAPSPGATGVAVELGVGGGDVVQSEGGAA